MSSYKDREKTEKYLLEQLEGHKEIYVKSKRIGETLGLSPKQIGQIMRYFKNSPELKVTKWSYSGSTTWKITKRGNR